jgi:hypothetical protein
LYVIEVVYRAPRAARCAGYLEQLEHLATEIWGVCAGGGADEDGFGFELLRVSNAHFYQGASVLTASNTPPTSA